MSSEDLAELEQLWTEANTKVFGVEYTAAEGRQASDNFHAAIESVWPQIVAELRALRLTDDDRAALRYALDAVDASEPPNAEVGPTTLAAGDDK